MSLDVFNLAAAMYIKNTNLRIISIDKIDLLKGVSTLFPALLLSGPDLLVYGQSWQG